MAGMLLGFGVMFAIMGAIWLIVEAFRTSSNWGLVCLLVPFGVVVFAIMRWDKAGAATLMLLAGVVCMLVAYGAAKGAPTPAAPGLLFW